MRPYYLNIRKSKKVFHFILLALVFFLIAGKAHESDSAFEGIKHSLPKREAGWKIIEAEEPFRQRDGSQQASFLWSNGIEEVSATVILYKSVKAAKGQFKSSHKGEPTMESFLIHGIGDEAYLFPPIILNQKGPFNLRFRISRFEIWVNADTKDTVLRCAQYIIDSILKPNKGIRPDRDSHSSH
jgi:hypothetical protein